MDVHDARARLALRLLRQRARPRDPSREVPARAGGAEMAGVAYVPTFQGLAPFDLVRPAGTRASCYPFDVPHALRFYRARNAIYYLFRALGDHTHRPLRVLMPHYNSGNS